MISSEVQEVLAVEEAPFDRQEKVLRGQVLAPCFEKFKEEFND